MIGFGANPPKNPHHRTAHGSWTDQHHRPGRRPGTSCTARSSAARPTPNDAYTDSRDDYVMNEVATDYNAGFTSALARLYREYGGTPLANFPVAETPDGPEIFVEAAVNASGTNVHRDQGASSATSRPGRPARSTNGSFRYYFTLDGGTTREPDHR